MTRYQADHRMPQHSRPTATLPLILGTNRANLRPAELHRGGAPGARGGIDRD